MSERTRPRTADQPGPARWDRRQEDRAATKPAAPPASLGPLIAPDPRKSRLLATDQPRRTGGGFAHRRPRNGLAQAVAQVAHLHKSRPRSGAGPRRLRHRGKGTEPWHPVGCPRQVAGRRCCGQLDQDRHKTALAGLRCGTRCQRRAVGHGRRPGSTHRSVARHRGARRAGGRRPERQGDRTGCGASRLVWGAVGPRRCATRYQRRASAP